MKARSLEPGRAWLAVLGLCILAGGTGCAGTMIGLDLDEVSDSPIALDAPLGGAGLIFVQLIGQLHHLRKFDGPSRFAHGCMILRQTINREVREGASRR